MRKSKSKFITVMQMVPGLSNLPQLSETNANTRLKAFITIMDSMTDQGTRLY